MKDAENDAPRWNELVEYALACVRTESAKAIVPLHTGRDDYPWFPIDGAELLITGLADKIAASLKVASHLEKIQKDGTSGNTTLVYGWPSVILRTFDERGEGKRSDKLFIAPLFVTTLEASKSEDAWTLTAAHEPEFNAAALAFRQEDGDKAHEIRSLPLEFGKPDRVAQAALEAARLLGYEPPILDPENQDCSCLSKGDVGVHNSAVLIEAPFAQFRRSVEHDLDALARRNDCDETAASWLLNMAVRKGAKPTAPLASVLPCNPSQQEALESARTNPLTVLTGPPGTGKTQLVVNAVANAWLNGETVLLSSTNNAAVDVAVERANRDIMPGMLIRTGSRKVKANVAEDISQATAKALKMKCDPPDVAMRALARTRGAEGLNQEKEVERLSGELYEIQRMRREAMENLVDASVRLRGHDPAVESPQIKHLKNNLREAMQKIRADAATPASELMQVHPTYKDADGDNKVVKSIVAQSGKRFPPDQIEMIRKKSKKLIGSGALQILDRRKLCNTVGCPIGTDMRDVHRWALSRQVIMHGEGVMNAVGGMRGKGAFQKIIQWCKAEKKLAAIENKFERNREKHAQLKKAIEDRDEVVKAGGDKWIECSMNALRAVVKAGLTSSGLRSAPDLSGVSHSARPFSLAVEKLLPYLRGWACTAMSVRGNFPLRPGLFDLVILDEATQCSIVDILPLAYRAKRMVVAGDPNQLRSISTIGDFQLRRIARDAGTNENALRNRGVHHKDGSAYQAFAHVSATQAHLLDEHYRCHPLIAKWFNQAFYGGKLKVLTKPKPRVIGERVVVWKDVDGESRRPKSGSGRGGWVNDGQVRETAKILNEVMDADMTVGVVAPYAAQASRIESFVRRHHNEDRLQEVRFTCGTAHRLQGSERDAILFATTLTPGMPANSAQWIQQERNLINVAVSRARRMLVVIGHPEQDAERCATLHSLREYIVSAQEGEAMGGAHAAAAQTDSDAELMLLHAMRKRGLKPVCKIDVEGFELDFAFLDERLKVNVEVDGDHHVDTRGRQRRQDLARDEILKTMGWQVIRLPAWWCYSTPDEAAAEVARIVN